MGEDIWLPQAEHLADSNVARLMRQLGAADYDALRRFSLDRPEAWWRAINAFCGVKWSRDYTALADLSRGPEHPRWFVGGELNWVDTVFGWADDPASADRAAVVAETEAGTVRKISYAELRARVLAFAGGLAAHGVGRGDRVGLLMESGIEAAVSLLALPCLGAIAVPLFSGFGADAVVSRLGACGASAIIATAGFVRRGRMIDTARVVREARAALPGVRHLILKAHDGAPPAADALDWEALAAAGETLRAPARMDPNDPFLVIYTSGTTGKPKGAVHTHGGFPLKIVQDATLHFDVRPGDVFCWPADMGWIAGPLITAASLMRGATMVCYDGAPDMPDWSRMSRIVERHAVTVFGAAPTLIRGLCAHEAEAMQGDVGTIRLMITSGESIDPDHFTWHRHAFGRGTAPLINYTGGTEVSGGLLSSVVVKPIRPAGFNAACPAVAVDVVGPQGQSLVGTVGELAIRAPFVGMTQSFWNDDGRYHDTYWRAIPGLWVHGDLALHAESGDYFMRGRSDDTLKVAGKRLGPAEVEDVLLEMPEISEAAAIGVDDPAKGQSLVVFVIPLGRPDDAAALAEAVAQRVEQRLGRAFRPGRVHLVGQLPKTRSSKVMRRVLRDAYCGTPSADLSALDNPSAIAEIAALRAAADDR